MPSGVVTCTSATPPPAGETAVTVVGDSTVKLAAFVPPNVTAVASLRFEPVIVTVVPPVEGPVVGEMLVTVGHCGAAGANARLWPPRVAMPPAPARPHVITGRARSRVVLSPSWP